MARGLGMVRASNYALLTVMELDPHGYPIDDLREEFGSQVLSNLFNERLVSVVNEMARMQVVVLTERGHDLASDILDHAPRMNDDYCAYRFDNPIIYRDCVDLVPQHVRDAERLDKQRSILLRQMADNIKKGVVNHYAANPLYGRF